MRGSTSPPRRRRRRPILAVRAGSLDSAMDAPAPRRSKRPAGLANLNTRSLDVANSFTLTETGTFQKGGFSIKATGIKQAPSLQHGDFSSLTLEQLEPLDYLGQGASGTVRLARHRESGHLLALKVINVLSDQGQRHQALNELKVLTSLHHPQLVPLFDAFYLEGNVFLALGYMNGGSLEQLLGSYTPLALAAGLEPRGLPEGVLSGLLLQMLCGLSYLHSMGVVHRDLKPANVLIDTTGHARLSDFGISKEMAATFVSSFVGTAAYMAPERINGAEYAMESDIWALGMVAIECALGAVRTPPAPPPRRNPIRCPPCTCLAGSSTTCLGPHRARAVVPCHPATLPPCHTATLPHCHTATLPHCHPATRAQHPFQHVPSYYDLVVQLSDGAAPPRLPPDAFSDGACRFIACSLDTSPECRPSAAELLRRAPPRLPGPAQRLQPRLCDGCLTPHHGPSSGLTHALAHAWAVVR